jgi:hypothetical protein
MEQLATLSKYLTLPLMRRSRRLHHPHRERVHHCVIVDIIAVVTHNERLFHVSSSSTHISHPTSSNPLQTCFFSFEFCENDGKQTETLDGRDQGGSPGGKSVPPVKNWVNYSCALRCTNITNTTRNPPEMLMLKRVGRISCGGRSLVTPLVKKLLCIRSWRSTSARKVSSWRTTTERSTKCVLSFS